ncbi:MarR family winged helix-turn-helix transcriptional regulator [Chachezhania antarctica]|uniref:MarR family winged helix-turn-helix transcriptional regulator n=1 Tax=Chachezhania antarctica TaxID=2340860 RepID=UPI000EB18B92|nr:MarR family transcriptional regulator [Chachezhania antarctica]
MEETQDLVQRDADYVLDDQIGYVLRLASQRHAVIFQNHVSDLTATQFSTLIRISEHGQVSQNHLGRLAAMDVATIKGVVDRLKAKGLVRSLPDPNDKRRSSITLTEDGQAMITQLKRDGAVISADTLAPLKPAEQKTLLALLKRIT